MLFTGKSCTRLLAEPHTHVIIYRMLKPDLEKIRAVALDMDGTLLNDQKEITPATKRCIERLQKKGIYPILVTGRSFEALKPFKEALGLRTPVISYNGAQIVDGITGKLLQDSPLSDTSSRFILELARRENIHVQAYRNGTLYFERHRPESEHYESHVNLKGEVVGFDSLEPLKFTKMMYVGKHSVLEKMKDTVLAAVGSTTSVMFSNDEFLEFMSKDVSKGRALLAVLSLLGISPKEAIAFGDGDNDIPLLQTAGIGVAMENASLSVKKAADFTAPSNNNDGIARFLHPLCGS